MIESNLIRYLLRENLLSEDVAGQVLRSVPESSPWLAGGALIQKGLVSEDTIKSAVSSICGYPVISLSQLRIPSYVARLLPRDEALKLLAIPIALKFEGGKEVLYVAFFDPCEESVIQRVQELTNKEVKPIISGLKEIIAAINRHLKDTKGLESSPGEESLSSIIAEDKTQPVAQDWNDEVPVPPNAVPIPSPPEEEYEEIQIDLDSEDSAVARVRRAEELDSQILDEPEIISERNVSATQLEEIISKKSPTDTEMNITVDFDNNEDVFIPHDMQNQHIDNSAQPHGGQKEDSIVIPSATELLNLPQNKRDTASGYDGQPPNVTYGLPDEMGEVELPDESISDDREEDLSLDIDELYSKLNVTTNSETNSELNSIDELFGDEGPSRPRYVDKKKEKKEKPKVDALTALEQLAEAKDDESDNDDEVQFIYDFISGKLPEFQDEQAERLARVLSALLRVLIEQRRISELDLLKEYFNK